MIRRSALVAAGAVALVLAPTAAMAYNAPGYGSTVSDSTPALGSPVTLTVTGADAKAAVTLTVMSEPATISNDKSEIAGTRSFTKNANSSGVATFVVTLSAAGTYTVQASVGSALVSDQILTVAHDEAVTGASLGATGFDGMGIAAGAGALVIGGAGAVLFVKRRQSAKAPD